MPEAVNAEASGADALHLHFGLSYANYLTVPRSALQSMPDEWQGWLAVLLEQLDAACVEHGIAWPPEGFWVRVELRPDSERDIPEYRDDLSRYDRGRRRLWTAIVTSATKGAPP